MTHRESICSLHFGGKIAVLLRHTDGDARCTCPERVLLGVQRRNYCASCRLTAQYANGRFPTALHAYRITSYIRSRGQVGFTKFIYLAATVVVG